MENANFTNKKCLINSPRSLQACFKLGIDPSELYQISMDEYKLLNPDVRHLPQDMIQFRYDAEEKYRNDSINQVKEERTKIINEKAEETERKNDENKDEANQNELDEKMKKIKEEETKALEKIKKKQKQDIESMIETQINNEIRQRQTLEKEKK